MANKTLPILYFNLSGEMFYVVQQRLEAQNVPKDKADQVLREIIAAMFRENLVEEIFKSQNLYTREAMEALFERIVHSSLMRLNGQSLNKLYDLMFMIFKFQVVNCLYPEDIILVTLNHLDAIKECSALTPDLKRKVETVIMSVIGRYRILIHLEIERIYDTIVKFLKDYNTKVSVLMKFGLQRSNGELVAADPVRKRNANELTFDPDEVVVTVGECVKRRWVESLPPSWCEVNGDRVIELGKNIYSMSKFEFQSKEKVSDSDKKTKEGKDYENLQAQEEITLLGRLIGNSCQSDFVPDIILASSDEDLEQCNKETFEKIDCCFMTINAAQTSRGGLALLSNGFDIEEKKETRSLLELLDSAGNGV